jgi:hypothetical protein
MSDDSEATHARERAVWIDDQMRHGVRRTMAETIRTGLAAGVGTTCSTVFIGILKWALIVLIGWVSGSIRF